MSTMPCFILQKFPLYRYTIYILKEKYLSRHIENMLLRRVFQVDIKKMNSATGYVIVQVVLYGILEASGLQRFTDGTPISLKTLKCAPSICIFINL